MYMMQLYKTLSAHQNKYCTRGRNRPANRYIYEGNEKDFQFKRKDTFLPHSQYPHPSIPPCYWTPFCLTQLYKQKFLGFSHLLLSSNDFMRLLTHTFSKIINHKLHKRSYLSKRLCLCRHMAWRNMNSFNTTQILKNKSSCVRQLYFIQHELSLLYVVVTLHKITYYWHFMTTDACD